jgi:N utilization substance protein B
MPKNKSWSRFIAVQVLFQMDFNERMGLEVSYIFDEKKINSIIKNMHHINKNLVEFKDLEYSVNSKWLISLLKEVILNKQDIDKNLSEKFDKNWSLKRMDSTLLSVLRCGCAEFLIFDNTPVKVIINEYTNIASTFFNEKEVDFVNGILDSLAQKFRSNELNK